MNTSGFSFVFVKCWTIYVAIIMSVDLYLGIIICRITEEHLWESRQLGAHSPYVLLSTLVYLNTKYFMLNSTDAHLELMFANVVKLFKKNGVSSDAKQTQTAFLRYNSAVYTGLQSLV